MYKKLPNMIYVPHDLFQPDHNFIFSFSFDQDDEDLDFDFELDLNLNSDLNLDSNLNLASDLDFDLDLDRDLGLDLELAIDLDRDRKQNEKRAGFFALELDFDVEEYEYLSKAEYEYLSKSENEDEEEDEAENQVEAEAENQAEAESQVEAEAENQAKAESQVEAENQAENQVEVKAENQAENQAEAEAENQVKAEAENQDHQDEDEDVPELTVLDYLKEQKRIRELLDPPSSGERVRLKSELWIQCEQCDAILYLTHLRDNGDLCMSCGHHLKMSSSDRIEALVDDGSWRPLFDQFSSCDPLEFEDYGVYAERTVRSQESTELLDALQTGTAFVDSVPIALAVMDFGYMGGSMGSVVGEKLTRIIEYATGKGLCLIVICASGGARMQEGSLSLMQMAKISAALYNYQKCANLPYINILTSPTTGGVTASFGMLADFIITEPKSIIGFAGRRVIEATIGEILPPNFQTAEYLIERGHVDIKVKRKYTREVVSNLIWAINNGYYKKPGFIKRGLYNGLTHFREEKARRVWKRGHGKSLKDLNSYYPNLTDKKLYASFNKRLAELKAKGANFDIFKEDDTEIADSDKVKNEENTNPSFLYTNPYKGEELELINLLEDPQSFLNRFEEKLPLWEKKRLKKLPNPNRFDEKYYKKEKSFSLHGKKKFHGTGRIEAPGKLIPSVPGIIKWIPLKAKRNSSAGIYGTENNGAGIYGTGNNGTGADITGIYGIKNNETGSNGAGTYTEISDTRKNRPVRNVRRKKKGPLIKLNSISSKQKFVPKDKGVYLLALKELLLDRASKISYFKVLETFEALVHLINVSIVEREEKKCKPVPFGFNYEKDCFLKRFTVLDEAVAFAKVQALHWRNVYDGASAPQKLASFFSGNKREKRLFYYILEKHINLLERKRANRLANAEKAANEKSTKKNADANVSARAASLQGDIEEDFNYVLDKKSKKPPKKK